MLTGTDIGLLDKQAQGVEGLTVATNSWDGVTDAVANRYKSAYTYDANGNMETLERYDEAGAQYDDLHFGYHKGANGQKVRNRLYNIQDLADQAGAYAQDIPHHPYVAAGIQDEEDANNTINSANNFSYDELGQRTRDEKAEIEHVEWTASGKVRKVRHYAASGKPELVFGYDAAGERISKQVGDPAQGGYREHYLRDAQGNIMAVYKYTSTGPASLQLTDRPIYGSKRLGSHTRPMEMVGTTPPQYYPYTQPMPAYRKHYELTDHLGNVATVITGRLLPDNSGTSAYQAEVLSAQGYEPFGMELPGRHWQSDVSRFGFQGQLKDREIAAIPFKYRMYSPDGSGFWSIDPLAAKYAYNSPYAFSENRVIDAVELEGLEKQIVIQQMNNNGSFTVLQIINNTDLENGHGSLGNGTYTLTYNASGTTFSEVYASAKGDPAKSFVALGVKASEWTPEERFTARMIVESVKTGLVEQGHSRADVERDVGFMDPSSGGLKTKYAHVQNADRYTKGWSKQLDSRSGTYTGAQSPELGDTGLSLKLYPSRGDAMGYVKSNLMKHVNEAGHEATEVVLGDFNKMHESNSDEYLRGRTAEPTKP